VDCRIFFFLSIFLSFLIITMSLILFPQAFAPKPSETLHLHYGSPAHSCPSPSTRNPAKQPAYRPHCQVLNRIDNNDNKSQISKQASKQQANRSIKRDQKEKKSRRQLQLSAFERIQIKRDIRVRKPGSSGQPKQNQNRQSCSSASAVCSSGRWRRSQRRSRERTPV